MSFVALPVFFEITMLLFPFCLWHDDDSRKHLWRHLPINLVANTNTFRPELIVTQDTLITFAPTKNRPAECQIWAAYVGLRSLRDKLHAWVQGLGQRLPTKIPLSLASPIYRATYPNNNRLRGGQNAKDWNTVLAIELDQLTELQVVI